MNLLNFYFSWFELTVFAVLLLAFAHQIYFYIRYIAGILRQKKRIKKNHVSFNTAKPTVSVIIASKDEEKNLRNFLPKVLEQNYPEFEVIVINDASTDDTDNVLDRFKKKYPHLRTTFVPHGTRNISTKKLAITLGIKSAKHEILLFTDADCFPESENWIADMVRNFAPETEFVLAYGAYLPKKGFLNRLITYDTLFIAMQYLGMAAAEKPYMGVGRNLAYRKETFFRLKGFSSALDILSGDDDLLVNKGSTAKNTAIEISKESLTRSEPKKRFKDWYHQKRRHLSSSVKYTGTTKTRLIAEPFTRGLFYLSLILTAVFGNLITLAMAGFLFLARLSTQLIIINRTARLYDKRRYFSTLLVFDILLPLINLFIMIFGKRTKVKWK
jgi:cellulose synthase/poly-beta-1,6-N-acetylglucosamine synthase-like glycosyltransferase